MLGLRFAPSQPTALNNESCPSAKKSSSEMGIWKEKNLYSQIGGVKKSEAMSPEDARNRMKERGCKDCECTYEDYKPNNP